ncbi:hypothetical protein [Nocardia sp. NPDC058497]|uniref:hypothetical protein n=1 Tax=Nocardia sp. NPDC058497 TaxID=3346529 RepID=UPI00365C3FF2
MSVRIALFGGIGYRSELITHAGNCGVQPREGFDHFRRVVENLLHSFQGTLPSQRTPTWYRGPATPSLGPPFAAAKDSESDAIFASAMEFAGSPAWSISKSRNPAPANC